MAHALLGAIEAKATGNNALAGATGAVGAELTAQLITEQLYGKNAKDLTEAQKETVSTLSQLAAGLSGALVGDSTQSAVASAEIGKRAVENNSLMGDEFRAGLNADKEEYKRKVREQFGENAVSQVLNGVINVVADTGDLTVLAADSAFDLAAAVVTCSIGEGYCNQAQKDLASKSQGAADILTSLINGETWSAIKTTANAAYNGDQVALENLSGVLIGITLPNKAIKGISANEKLPVASKIKGYNLETVSVNLNKPGQVFNEIISNISGKIDGIYDATLNGSLPASIAETFSGGRYAVIKLDKNLNAYRTWSPGQSKEFGAFWTIDKPLGSLQSRIDSALRPEWGNIAGTSFYSQSSRYTEIMIPKGTVINIGEVGSQGGAWIGGKSQLLINGGVQKEWKIGERDLK